MGFFQWVLLHVASCWFLMGLIWCIQWVHYPSFLWVDSRRFDTFVEFHARRISHIVVVLMSVELLTAVVLWFLSSSETWLWTLNILSVVFIWLSTYLLSVPCHKSLYFQKNKAIIYKLIWTNWPRTVLWTLRGFAWLWVLSYLVRWKV